MLPREADAAEHLDRAAAELRERVARERLGHHRGAVRLRRVGVVGGPARVVAGRPAELERAQHVGAEVLDGLERADRLVELHALLGVLDGERRARAAAAPTPSTTYATASRSSVRATASARRRCRAASPARRRTRPSPPCGCRRPSASARPTRRRRRRCTANTPSAPSGSRAVTRNRSAAVPVGDVHLRAVEPPHLAVGARRGRRLAPPVARRRLVHRDRADRRPVGQPGQQEVVLPRRAGRRARARPRRSPTTRTAPGTARRPAPRARPRRRPCPCPRRRAPRARAGRPRRGRAARSRRRRGRARRVGLVRVAHVADRRLVGEEAAHRIAQHLLVGRELEVHDAPARFG